MVPATAQVAPTSGAAKPKVSATRTVEQSYRDNAQESEASRRGGGGIDFKGGIAYRVGWPGGWHGK
jgi:hypothetical protein